jgi:hypothetical protein
VGEVSRSVAGWHFARNADGSVTIYAAPIADTPDREITMEPAVWAGIVAAVSSTGDEAYHRALGLHSGEPL